MIPAVLLLAPTVLFVPDVLCVPGARAGGRRNGRGYNRRTVVAVLLSAGGGRGGIVAELRVVTCEIVFLRRIG